MPVVTRGSFYHTIPGVAARSPVREFSGPLVGFLDARLRSLPMFQDPGSGGPPEGRSGRCREAIRGGQRMAGKADLPVNR